MFPNQSSARPVVPDAPAEVDRLTPDQQGEIEAQRAVAHTMRRTTVAALEDLVFSWRAGCGL